MAMLSMSTLSSEFKKMSGDRRVTAWVESYRDFLDQGQFWEERVNFDVARLATGAVKVPAQVSVRCTYCAHPITAAKGPGAALNKGRSTQRAPMSACPSCRKPLPRCSLCSLYLGTPLPVNVGANVEESSNLDSWFTWCQVCPAYTHLPSLPSTRTCTSPPHIYFWLLTYDLGALAFGLLYFWFLIFITEKRN